MHFYHILLGSSGVVPDCFYFFANYSALICRIISKKMPFVFTEDILQGIKKQMAKIKICKIIFNIGKIAEY